MKTPHAPGPESTTETWLRTPADAVAEGMAQGRTGRAVTFVMLWAVGSVGAGALMARAAATPKVPDLSAVDVGKPFRSAGPAGLKATRDYEVVDSVATEAARARAVASVRPVFDYDPSVRSSTERAVQEAFESMRTEALAFDKLHGRDVKESPEFLSAMRAHKASFVERAPVVDEDFDALAHARFSLAAEQAATALLEDIYAGHVVPVREELSRVDADGIAVRVLGGRSETVRSTRPPSVMDVREASLELERLVSLPGNVLPEGSPMLRRAVMRLAKRQLRSNLTINLAETEARRLKAAAQVSPVVISVKKGQKVLGDGELITPTHLVLVAAMRASGHEYESLQQRVGETGAVGLLVLAAWLFHRTAFRRFAPSRKDALFLVVWGLTVLGALTVAASVFDAVHERYSQFPAESLRFAFPVAAGAMLVRFVLRQELALFLALVLSSLAGLVMGHSLPYALFSLVTSLVAADRVSRANDRAGVLKAGAWTGLVASGLTLFFALAEGRGVGQEQGVAALCAFIGASLVAPMVVLALTPMAEALFGYASDIKLLELANLNHPALKELIVRAPGTYHHSIVMGSLVEAAAEAIGANPLLARTCAYYHDIGKGKNPTFFGENQKGENPHDAMAPAMSAMIIRRHVTDGIEMARRYRLPRLVAAAIPQHHGTRNVGFFYLKAQKELAGKEDAPAVDERLFRYDGPKPQFPEAALVMLADAAEAASRAGGESSREALEALVRKLVRGIFQDGQLDECDLTLKDLNAITLSFVTTLEGIYHARPVYPPGAMGPTVTGEVPKPSLRVLGADGRS